VFDKNEGSANDEGECRVLRWSDEE